MQEYMYFIINYLKFKIMGPKKKAADGDTVDVSCEHFFKLYQKLCRGSEPPLPICKTVKEKYDKEYLED